MRTAFLYISVIFLVIGCASSEKVVSAEQKSKVENLVTTKSFEIDSQWAYPMVTSSLISLQNAGFFPNNSTASMIDITGHNQYFIFKKDSVNANLPYYGERQMGAAYSRSNSGGIEFNGVPEDYSMNKTKNGDYRIKFKIKDKNALTETYNVSILIYNNMSAKINVFSSSRFKIEYRGKLKELATKDI
ncbi:uncharacterized protein DUF4251 [Tenacibaculum skagerrakense]|uniref:Uncharacterized protein DUF4251 n=1 Tax=Tenacibaculum skagerrakense TaxID=186571 RepID=A0A4R2NUS6_9FLAO|nr:DUF4251 domain-containing protein [Tenacibaculum skagerrakense]TCP25849.1 uncharacterized protein DUF4251 [Tenacibaculum skagerrakense]